VAVHSMPRYDARCARRQYVAHDIAGGAARYAVPSSHASHLREWHGQIAAGARQEAASSCW